MTALFPCMMNALLLGLIGGAIPGPVLSATFAQVLEGGWRSSLRIVIWSLCIEALVALITMRLLAYLQPASPMFTALSVIGAAVLIWMASALWRIKHIDASQPHLFSYRAIAAMILSNGALWTFWITVCAPQALQLGQELPGGEYVFLSLFEIGWFSSTVALAGVFAGFRPWLSHPRVVPVLFRCFALTFVYFAVTLLLSLLR